MKGKLKYFSAVEKFGLFDEVETFLSVFLTYIQYVPESVSNDFEYIRNWLWDLN